LIQIQEALSKAEDTCTAELLSKSGTSFAKMKINLSKINKNITKSNNNESMASPAASDVMNPKIYNDPH